MHAKLSLDLSDLRVESFETTSSGSKQAHGTVFAQSGYSELCTNNTGCYTCENTCDCQNSFVQCGTDDATCAGGCGDACEDNRTSNFGWVSCDHSACAEYTCDLDGTCDTADPEVCLDD